MEVDVSECLLAFLSAYCETFMYKRREDAMRNAENMRGRSIVTTANTSFALLFFI